MEENIKNEIVEKAADAMMEAAENLDKAIAETGVKPASALTELKKPVTGKNLALCAGTFFGGIATGVAIDHWVVPAISKGLDKLKEKRAKKKAEKAAKKAAKAAANAQEKKPEPAPAASTESDGIDPNTVDTTIKD